MKREVTIKIKLDDKDVDKGVASLKRLEKASKEVGQSAKDIDSTEQSVSGLSGSFDNLSGMVGPASAVIAAFVAVITAVGFAAYKTAQFMFDLSKGFADYVSQVKRANQATGLSTDTLSALKFQAQKTGLEFDVIIDGIKDFTKNIGEAEKGSKSARENLLRLGIDSKSAVQDVDTAFSQAIKKIAELPPGVQRSTLAMDLFGESGLKLIPFIEKFDGDLNQLIKTADEYGFIIGDDGVQASEEFSNALKEIELSVEGVKLMLGKEFAPVVANVLNDFSYWLKSNKNEVIAWGESIAQWATNAVNNLRLLYAVGASIYTGTSVPLNAWQSNMREQKQRDEDRARSQKFQSLGITPTASDLDRLARSSSPDLLGSGGSGSKSRTPKRDDKDDWMGWNPTRANANQRLIIRKELESLLNKRETQVFLETLKIIEGGKSPNIVFGGKTPQYAPNLNQHPGKLGMGAMGPAGFSTAAGFYQITQSNWNWISKIIGSEKFSIENQQLGALLIMMSQANSGFQKLAKGDLLGGLKSGTQPWAASPFSTLPGRKRKDILQVAENLSGSVEFDKQQNESEISRLLTQNKERERLEKLIELFKKNNLIPAGDILSEFKKYFDEESRNAGVAELTNGEIQEWFERNRAANQTVGELIDLIPSTVSTEITPRTVLSNEYIQQVFSLDDKIIPQIYRDEGVNEAGISASEEAERFEKANQRILNLEKDYVSSLRDSLELGRRRRELSYRQGNYEQIVNDLLADRLLSQDEELQNLTEQFELQVKLLANDEYRNNQETIEFLREKHSLTEEIFSLEIQLANQGKNDDLKIQAAYLQDIIELRNRELDAVIAINQAELQISQSMEISNNQIRARIYEHLASQKTMNESIADGIIGTYEAIATRAESVLDRLNEKTKGFLSFIIEPMKAIQRNLLTNFTTSIVDSIFPGLSGELNKTNNPIARPIVDEVSKSNTILQSIDRNIAAATNGTPATASLGSLGGIGGFLSSILTGGGGGGIGGTAPFNPNSQGGGFNLFGRNGSRTGDVVDGIMQVFAGDKGRGDFMSNIKNIFSGKDGSLFGKGGIFGAEGFGNNTGTYSGIGGIMGIVGGLIGGKAGSVISGIGSGMAMGASIGTMIMPGIGTAIGAAAGAIAGFFATIFGNPKRKRDKNEKMPQLQQGFTDAMKQFNELISQVRTLSIDPMEALNKGKEIRSEIASGFGIAFESKHYKKISQNRIREQLALIDREPDGLMAQLKSAVEQAKGAADRNKRILPEFAGGVYIPNGLIPGIFDSKDDVLAMLSRGEMVLNPNQQNRVRANAGFDVFASAGIPNYPKPSASAKMATGGIAGGSLKIQPSTVVVQPRFTLYAEGVTFDERSKMWMESDDGKRTMIEINKKLKRSGDIK